MSTKAKNDLKRRQLSGKKLKFGWKHDGILMYDRILHTHHRSNRVISTE